MDVVVAKGTDVTVGETVVVAAGGSGVSVDSFSILIPSSHADAKANKRISGMNTRTEIGLRTIRFMSSP